MVQDRRELGPEHLKALTHPLRVEILHALRMDGPATATALAKRLGESSGATSYHLRQLERHGFVEEDPDSGNGRDRWWRPAYRGQSVNPSTWTGVDESALDVYATYEAANLRTHTERAAEYLNEHDQWDRAWIDAAAFSGYVFQLNPARLTELVERMHALLDTYLDDPAPDAEQVVVQFQAFPRRVRPFEEES